VPRTGAPCCGTSGWAGATAAPAPDNLVAEGRLVPRRSTRLPVAAAVAALGLTLPAARGRTGEPRPTQGGERGGTHGGGVLTGTVRDATGRPLAGAFVSAYDTAGPGTTITVTVVSDAAGRFRFPGPPRPGPARVVARRPGYEPASRGAAPGGTSVLDFVLAPAADTFAQAPSASLLALLPDGADKRRFALDCTGCHQFDQRVLRPNGAPRSHDAWVARVRQMLSFAGPASSFPIIAPGRDPDSTASWLTRYLGQRSARGAPPVVLPEAPAGDAARAVFTEYDLPDPRDLPHDLMLTPDGRVVITGMMSGDMYVLDPESGHFEREAIPIPRANPRALHVDPDGTWWVLLGAPHKIARRDGRTGAWSFHDVGMYGHSVARDGAGGVWFNGHFTHDPALVGRLDERTGAVRTYEIPAAAESPTGGGPIPYELRTGDDGSVWGSELHGNRVFRLTPATGAFRLYAMPSAHSGPRRLDVAGDGVVWIPAYAAGTLARLDPATGRVVEYPLPTRDALPYVARVDRRSGMVWVGTGAGDLLARFDPRRERWTEYPLPSRGALVRHLDVDPRTGTVWAAYSPAPGAPPKILRLEAEGSNE
jgi:virginiamycin B lyase